MSLLTESLACLHSLRPLLVAIMGYTKTPSGQRSNDSGRPLGASNSSNSTHIIWPKIHQETTYVLEVRIEAKAPPKTPGSAKA